MKRRKEVSLLVRVTVPASMTKAEAAGAIVIDRILSDSEQYGLLNLCDCYVSLHRSEGFGLTMAEAVKVGTILLLLYLVFSTYKEVVAIEFIGSFIVSVAIFASAIMVPEQQSEPSKSLYHNET